MSDKPDTAISACRTIALDYIRRYKENGSVDITELNSNLIHDINPLISAFADEGADDILAKIFIETRLGDSQYDWPWAIESRALARYKETDEYPEFGKCSLNMLIEWAQNPYLHAKQVHYALMACSTLHGSSGLYHLLLVTPKVILEDAVRRFLYQLEKSDITESMDAKRYMLQCCIDVRGWPVIQTLYLLGGTNQKMTSNDLIAIENNQQTLFTDSEKQDLYEAFKAQYCLLVR